MKKLFAMLAIAGFLTACNDEAETTETGDTTITTTVTPDTLSTTPDTTTVIVDSTVTTDTTTR